MVEKPSAGEFRRLTVVILQVAVFFLVVAPRSLTDANKGEDYLKGIEESVKRLAERVAEIYPSQLQCGVDAQTACSVCSQDECRPLIGNLECVNVTENPRCSARFEGCTSSIRVSKEHSGTAYPREKLDDPPENAQARSICGTKDLDATFIDLFKKNRYHADYYVGFTDGGRRLYPGREEADETSLYPCTAYDCRKRPWYNAAITYQNHLVVLVDTRSGTLDPAFGEKKSPLSLAKEFAKDLLYSVYAEDRINVVPFDSGPQAEALVPSSVAVKFNITDPQYHEELKGLEDKLGQLSNPVEDSVKSTSANLTTALQEALRLFGAADDKMSKNIILFTTGGILYDELLNRTLDEVAGNFIRLFVYSMKSTDEKLQVLNDLALRAKGIHIKLTSSKNPVYQMRSYFGYLASLQQPAGRLMPFWTPPYTDYYDIAEITTVAVPIFSNKTGTASTRFIGVAAIDVLYLEIVDILEEFKAALQDRAVKEGTNGESVFSSVIPFDDSLESADSCSFPEGARAIAMCKSDENPKTDFISRFCCDTCAKPDSDSIVWTIIGSLVGGFLFVALVSTGVYLYIRRWPPTPEQGGPPVQNGTSQARSPPGTPVQNGTSQARSPPGTPAKFESGSLHKTRQTLWKLCSVPLSERKNEVHD